MRCVFSRGHTHYPVTDSVSVADSENPGGTQLLVISPFYLSIRHTVNLLSQWFCLFGHTSEYGIRLRTLGGSARRDCRRRGCRTHERDDSLDSLHDGPALDDRLLGYRVLFRDETRRVPRQSVVLRLGRQQPRDCGPPFSQVAPVPIYVGARPAPCM